MACFVGRLAAVVLVLGTVACSGPNPVPADAGSSLLSQFHDPFGRRPVELSLSAGTHIRIAYVDSLFDTRSPRDQRQHAHAIARALWAAFGGAHGIDTVSVAFTEREGRGLARAQQTTRTFLFYPEQLQAAPRQPARAATR